MKRSDPIERFRAKFHPGDAAECWSWMASISSCGYGKFWNGEREVGAHRFAYELAVGAIPDGLQIDHLCRNRACVNPAHLEAVTRKENILRGTAWSAINARKTHCVHGHDLSDAYRINTPVGIARHCRTCALDRAKNMSEKSRDRRRAYDARRKHIKREQDRRRYLARKEQAA